MFLSEKIQIEDKEKEFISGKAELLNAFCEKQVFIFYPKAIAVCCTVVRVLNSFMPKKVKYCFQKML